MQFAPGESKTARAPIVVKPSGLSCATELYLVSNSTKVATSGMKSFTSTGAKQDISFPITMPSAEGTYPVYLDIFSDGLLIGAYQAVEDVVVAPLGLVLRFSNPRKEAFYWAAWLYDLDLGESVESIKEAPLMNLEQAITFYATAGHTFLLYIQEMNAGPYTFGPYLITIPELGSYTWNSREGRMNGISAVELPKTNNRCLATGILQSVDPYESRASILLEEAADIPGYVNVGQYFVGTTIEITKGTIPWMTTGRRVTCYLRMYQGTWLAGWEASNFRYYTPYPPEAFEFSGSLSAKRIGETWAGTPIWEANYSISGTLPQFRVVLAMEEPHPEAGIQYGYEIDLGLISSGVGKVEDWRFGITFYGTKVVMFAHPDPNAVWGQDWKLENWQLVASYPVS